MLTGAGGQGETAEGGRRFQTVLSAETTKMLAEYQNAE